MDKTGAKPIDSNFIKQLVKYCMELKEMKPRNIYIFNVIADYGSYQIIVGPEYTDKECKKLHLKPHSRKLTVNGKLHHLFVNPKRIAPVPNQEDIRSNLKGSIIMKKIIIHIVDRNGDGRSILLDRFDRSMVRAKQRINLAGMDGVNLLQKFNTTGRLVRETYKIIQEDILKALKSHRG